MAKCCPRLVVFAASTGGPFALEKVLSAMAKPPVPIVIVQHLGRNFSERLAGRLASRCGFPVVVATNGMSIESGAAYLAPGGSHMRLERIADGIVARITDEEPVHACRPSADVTFASAADLFGGAVVAVVLTGLGADGTDGCRELAAEGAAILVQDEASSVAWGMPGAVVHANIGAEVASLDDLGARIDLRLSESARRPRIGGGQRP